MRDVPWGWLIRYMHSTGASAFFVVVYLHMFRGLMYGSYRKPRELVWIFGCGIFLVLMAEAFMGYLLPWGQMSYWGAQVIVNLFSAVPVIGPDLALLIRGDFVVGDATLNRFFSFHVIAVPLVLLGLVVYTAAFVAEVVRAGIASVPRGQTEAASSLGLSHGHTMRLVVLPQALRVIIPPMTNQYLNLTKNSSLAVAIGYPDVVSIANTALNQTGRAVECIAIVMLVYLTTSLATSALMNWYNARAAIKER
jgi:quinol-cytochrome oxidoreductase complex cytochrome b subunit